MYLAVDFQGGIENAWSNVATFVPRAVTDLLGAMQGGQPATPGSYDTTGGNAGPDGASAARGLGEVAAAGRRFRRDR